MKVYNKLIRDHIPAIIEKSGKKPIIRTLKEEEYIKSLNLKLQEELDEYYENEDIEELADLVELVYAILKFKGVSLQEFEEIRQQKKEIRGGFDSRLFLERVEG
ncbi:nucleoside triphosphate pyrophosphohydrolase [Alkaliphilus transvaalensis]|uniref:nucleoside triphosphate pyrophosphohydrolase n=1 Tax=Alkaliphilus transvaalensis TaxID=114628 RepID=UPI00047BF210|nr:nucleoside triphosphate pyrophosphohydrolase [Alkaliphilus transvaalensis]